MVFVSSSFAFSIGLKYEFITPTHKIYIVEHIKQQDVKGYDK